jgi:hypothetical protein
MLMGFDSFHLRSHRMYISQVVQFQSCATERMFTDRDADYGRPKDRSTECSCRCGIFRSTARAETGTSRGRCKSCVWPRDARCCSPRKSLECCRSTKLAVAARVKQVDSRLILEGRSPTWRRAVVAVLS